METSSPEKPLIIRRRRRVFAQKATDNFVAVSEPASGNRKGAGAPKGNRNAFRHGLRSADFVEGRRHFAAARRAVSAMCRLAPQVLRRCGDPVLIEAEINSLA